MTLVLPVCFFAKLGTDTIIMLVIMFYWGMMRYIRNSSSV